MLIKSNNEYYQRFQFSGISRDLSLHRGLVTGGLVIGRQWVVILLSWRRGVGVWLSRGRVGKLLPRGCVESRGCVWHARIVLSRVRLCRVHTGYCVCCSDDRLLAPVRVDHSAQLVPPLRRATAADDSYNGNGHGGANGQYNGADYSCAVTSRLNVLKVGLS